MYISMYVTFKTHVQNQWEAEKGLLKMEFYTESRSQCRTNFPWLTPKTTGLILLLLLLLLLLSL